MYVDEFGYEWESEHSYLGAAVKLDCPAGQPISQLMRTATRPNITYLRPGWVSSRQWPPDATSVNYGEKCNCEECGGRLVGETVAKLKQQVDEIHATTKVHIDTYQLRYLED